jgi:hypothetical protein
MRPSPDVVWRDLEGEAVLLDLVSGIYFGLNEVGTRIWQMLDEGCDVSRVIDVIASEYDADRSEVEKDLRALLGELHKRGLVIDGAPDPA